MALETIAPLYGKVGTLARYAPLCGSGLSARRDPQTFHQLIVQLNDLLERKEKRLEESQHEKT